MTDWHKKALQYWQENQSLRAEVDMLRERLEQPCGRDCVPGQAYLALQKSVAE